MLRPRSVARFGCKNTVLFTYKNGPNMVLIKPKGAWILVISKIS